MRLLACLVLTTLVASAFTQDFPSAQIEAVNDLPNVHVQLLNHGSPMFRDGEAPMEVETSDSAVDPSSVIVDAVSDAVETVAASMSQDAPVEEEEVVVEEEAVQEDPAPTLEVSEDEVVVDEEAVQEDPAPTLEVSEDEVLGDEEAVQEDPYPTLEVSEDEVVVDEEAVQEEPAPTLEVVEEEAAEVDETLPEEDEPILQAVVAETPAPEAAAMEDVESTLELDDPSTMSVVEPEPEPAPEDTKQDEQFTAEEPDPVVQMEEEVVELEEPRKPTKKELKAVEKYNAAADNVIKILSQRLKQKDALPLEVDEEVLVRLDVEVTTLPPTTLPPPTPPPSVSEAPTETECPAKWVTKCGTDKCKRKDKCMEKCKAKGCLKKKKKNKNKNKNRKDEKNNKNKNNNKNKKSKNNKNKRKNQNKRIRNKLFKPRMSVDSSHVYSRRQSKNLNLEEVEQARRKGSSNKKQGRKGNKRKQNQSRLEPEAKVDYVPKSAQEGPLFPSSEELLSAPAVFMGYSNMRREGDVQVDLSGKFPKFVATIVMSPLNVLLTNPASPLTRSEVTTELTAQMHFTSKQARKRDKLKINEVTVEVPEDESVSVLRFDLDLELDVISAAQDEVSSAIDTDRVARIIHHELAAAFDEDNILQNLEDHPSLKA